MQTCYQLASRAAALRRRITVLTLAAALAAPAALADAVDDYIAEARDYFSNGQLNAAVIQLKNALQEAPNNAEARYLLGIAYLQIGDVRTAEKELRRALELGWERRRVLIPLARVMLFRNEPETVLREINVEDDDDDALRSDVLALRGLAYLVLSRADDARDVINQALALDPEGIEAIMAGARLALLGRDFELALARLDKVIEAAPRRLEAWITRAQVEQLMGRHEGAIDTFGKLLELQPSNLRALIGRAQSLSQLGRADAAMDDVEAVLAEQPRQPDANFLKAQLLTADNDLDGAEAALSRVRLGRPDHQGAQLLSAMLFYRQGSYAQAVDSAERFLKQQPDHLPATKLLAAAQTRLQQPERVVKLLEPLAATPAIAADAQFYTLLGNAQLQTGDFRNGAASLAKAAEIAPDEPQLRTQLAMTHLAMGDTQGAVSELQTAVDLGDDLLRADLLLITTYLRTDQFDEALAAAEALVERRPDDPIAFNLLGAVHMASGNAEAARDAFNRQLDLRPNMPEAQINLAKLDLQANDLDAAAGRYQALLDVDTNDLRALLGMAQIAELQGDSDGRVEWLLRAWQAHPESTRSGALLVDLYLQRGERLRALNLARDVQYRAPDDPVAVNALGRALLANNEAASAVTSFETLAQQTPKSVDAWLQLGLAQLNSERWRAAELSLGKALELDPDQVKAITMMAQLDMRARRYDSALQRAARLKTLAPEQAVGFSVEGDVLRTQGDYASAARAYRQAIALQPSSELAVGLAFANLRLEQPEQAIEALRDWLQRDPDDVPVRVRLARLLERSDGAEAAVEYEQVLEREPANIVALNNLAWIYIDQGNSKSVEYAQRANDLAPGRPEVTDTYGWALVQSGDAERGLLLLQQAALQAPHIPDIRYHLAIAYDKLGRTDDAVEELESIVADGREFSQMEDARRMLERLRKS